MTFLKSLTASCRARSQNPELRLWAPCMVPPRASGRSGFLWPLSRIASEFLKLPGVPGNKLRTDVELVTAELGPETEALGTFHNEQGLGEEGRFSPDLCGH